MILDQNGNHYKEDFFSHSGSGFGGDDSFLKNLDVSRAIRFVYGQLDQMYVGSSTCRNIVELPVKNSLKNWGEFSADSSKIEEELAKEFKRLGVRKLIKESAYWDRLYGGSVLLPIFKGDKSPKMSLPLSGRGREIDHIKVVPGPRVYPERYEAGDMVDAGFGEPLVYSVSIDAMFMSKLFSVHASRIIRVNGLPLPMEQRNVYKGFGQGILENVFTELAQHWGAKTASSEVLKDFVLTVYKSKNLMEKVAANGAVAVREFFHKYSQALSIHKVIPISDDEEFSKQATPITGLDTLLKEHRVELCAAARIPQSILYGNEGGALGSNAGQNDIYNFNSECASEQVETYSPPIEIIKDYICDSIGVSRDAAEFVWNPIVTETKKEELENINLRLDGICKAIDYNIASPKEGAEHLAKNKGNYFEGMTIDPNKQSLELDDTSDESESLAIAKEIAEQTKRSTSSEVSEGDRK